MIPSPYHADGAGAAIVAPRSPVRSGRREEIEAGAGGGARQVEAKIGVGEGEAGEDALVDLSLAGAEEAAQMLGVVAHRDAGAALQRGDEAREGVRFHELTEAIRSEGGEGRRLDGQEMPRDDNEDSHGGRLVPAQHAHRLPL